MSKESIVHKSKNVTALKDELKAMGVGDDEEYIVDDMDEDDFDYEYEDMDDEDEQ